MKATIPAILLILAFTHVSGQDTTEIIKNIDKKVNDLYQINIYRVVTIEQEAFLDKGFIQQPGLGYGHLTAYFKNDTIYRIDEHIGVRLLKDVATTNYFFSAGKLIFVKEIEFYGPDVFIDVDGTVDQKNEGPDYEGSYYFYGDKFISITKGQQQILPNEKFFDSQSKEGQLEYSAQKYFGMMNNKDFLSGVISHTKSVTAQFNELIVVFKKDIELKKAMEILDRSSVKYKEGMDSSKGMQYFSITGPKFIITFYTKEDKEKFLLDNKNTLEIYEIYVPDWKVQKD
jgi:hypothetical protein